jgi:hypothetical protein
MEQETPDYVNTARIFLKKPLHQRMLLANNKANTYFKENSKGNKISEEMANMLQRHFYLSLLKVNQVYTDHQSDEIQDIIKEKIQDLSLLFGMSSKYIHQILESGYEEDKRKDSEKKRKGMNNISEVVTEIMKNLKQNVPQTYMDVWAEFKKHDPNFTYSSARRRFQEQGGK